MAERGSLTGLEVTMRFPPSSLKLKGELAIKNAAVNKEFFWKMGKKNYPRFATRQLSSTTALFVNFVLLLPIMWVFISHNVGCYLIFMLNSLNQII